MPENSVTAPLAPMEPQDVAFAYIRALQASDIDTASAVIDGIGPEVLRLLLDIAARMVIPITAVDDHDGEPCAHSFLAAACRTVSAGTRPRRRVPGRCAGHRPDHRPLHREHPHRRTRR
ncbi:hypothetical protein ACFXPB_37045, partial [Streptomyces sp. NPDC059129]